MSTSIVLINPLGYRRRDFDGHGVVRTPQDVARLMAGVLTNMVEQRIAMDARKAQMEEAMMQHMMQHMQMGKESMSQCPTMKGMKDTDDKSAGAYKEQLGAQK